MNLADATSLTVGLTYYDRLTTDGILSLGTQRSRKNKKLL